MRSAALGAALALASCGLPEGDYFGTVPEPDPTHLRYCNAGEPEYVDPGLVTTTESVRVTYALYTGLTDHDMEGLPEPAIATHWEVSPDQQTFTFHLRDDARWSNGRPITSQDFRYSMTRVLHPLTASRNAEALWRLVNGELYTAGRVRVLVRDVPPFRAGEAVEVLGANGHPYAKWVEAEQPMPDSNARTGAARLKLRDLGAPEADAYATVPAETEVTLVELGGDARDWAYVHWVDGNDGYGVYGWVPAAELTGQPNAGVVYDVQSTSDPDNYERRGRVLGADALLLPDVLGIDTPDPQTLVLRTEYPVPQLIQMTLQRPFRPTPREVVSRHPKRWTLPEYIVTSGAFHLVEWRTRDRIELVKSETYWDKDSVKLDRFTIYSIDDPAAAAHVYYQGGCDAIAPGNMPGSYIPILTGEKRGGKPFKDFSISPSLGIYYYMINTERFPNVHLRRALAHATNREPLGKLLYGTALPSEQYMPGTPISELSDDELALCGVTRDTPGFATIVVAGELCYVPPFAPGYDPDKARAELALARQEMGDAFPKSISIKFNCCYEYHKWIAEYVQHEWQKVLGIDVELEVQEWKTYIKDTIVGNFDVGRFGGIGNLPDIEVEFLPDFRCGGPANRTKFCNEEFERHIRAALAEPNYRKRLALAREAERVMVEQVPIIPLYVYTQRNLVKPYVRDLAINSVQQIPFRKVWIDPDWKRASAESPR